MAGGEPATEILPRIVLQRDDMGPADRSRRGVSKKRGRALPPGLAPPGRRAELFPLVCARISRLAKRGEYRAARTYLAKS